MTVINRDETTVTENDTKTAKAIYDRWCANPASWPLADRLCGHRKAVETEVYRLIREDEEQGDRHE